MVPVTTNQVYSYKIHINPYDNGLIISSSRWDPHLAATMFGVVTRMALRALVLSLGGP